LKKEKSVVHWLPGLLPKKKEGGGSRPGGNGRGTRPPTLYSGKKEGKKRCLSSISFGGERGVIFVHPPSKGRRSFTGERKERRCSGFFREKERGGERHLPPARTEKKKKDNPYNPLHIGKSPSTNLAFLPPMPKGRGEGKERKKRDSHGRNFQPSRTGGKGEEENRERWGPLLRAGGKKREKKKEGSQSENNPSKEGRILSCEAGGRKTPFQ